MADYKPSRFNNCGGCGFGTEPGNTVDFLQAALDAGQVRLLLQGTTELSTTEYSSRRNLLAQDCAKLILAGACSQFIYHTNAQGTYELRSRLHAVE